MSAIIIDIATGKTVATFDSWDEADECFDEWCGRLPHAALDIVSFHDEALTETPSYND